MQTSAISSQRPNFQLIDQHLDDVKQYSLTSFQEDLIGKQYDKLCDKYEVVLRECVGYADPDVIAQAVSEINGLARDATILDFASGTGLIGEALRKYGFTTFDGLDASEGMINLCKEKNLYRTIHNMYLGNGPLPDEFRGTYDVAVSAGSFIPGHLPSLTLTQMTDSVKVGGFVLFSKRNKYYEDLGHKKVIDELVESGSLRFVKEYTWIKYEGMEERSYGIFYPDPASVLVFEKIKNL